MVSPCDRVSQISLLKFYVCNYGFYLVMSRFFCSSSILGRRFFLLFLILLVILPFFYFLSWNAFPSSTHVQPRPPLKSPGGDRRKTLEDLVKFDEKTGKNSMHRCIGGGSVGTSDYGFITPSFDYKLQSCEFTNVCYERAKDRFLYFSSVDASKRIPFAMAEPENPNGGEKEVFGNINEILPEKLVGIKPRALVIDDKTWVTTYEPTQMRMEQILGDVPRNVTWVEGDFMVLKRWAGANWGHTLVQAVMPAFILMQQFGSDDEEFQKNMNFVFLDDCFDVKDKMVAFPSELKFRKICHKFSQTTFGLLSSIQPRTIKDVEPDSDFVCFRRLLAGTQGHSMMNAKTTNDGGMGSFFQKFRAFSFQKNGFPKTRKDGPFRVTVCGKGKVSFNSRGIGNVNDVVEYVNTKFQSQNGEAIEAIRLDLETTPLLEQAKILSETDLLITPGGATGMCSVFLPDGASAIVAPLCAQAECPMPDHSLCVCNGGYCCFHLDNYFYYYLTTNVMVLPVHVPNDIGRGCDCKNSICKNCNVHVKMEKLKGMIQRSMHFTMTYRKTHSRWRDLY